MTRKLAKVEAHVFKEFARAIVDSLRSQEGEEELFTPGATLPPRSAYSRSEERPSGITFISPQKGAKD